MTSSQIEKHEEIALRFVFSERSSVQRRSEVLCEKRSLPNGVDAGLRCVGVVDEGGAISGGEEIVVIDELERGSDMNESSPFGGKTGFGEEGLTGGAGDPDECVAANIFTAFEEKFSLVYGGDALVILDCESSFATPAFSTFCNGLGQTFEDSLTAFYDGGCDQAIGHRLQSVLKSERKFDTAGTSADDDEMKWFA